MRCGEIELSSITIDPYCPQPDELLLIHKNPKCPLIVRLITIRGRSLRASRNSRVLKFRAFSRTGSKINLAVNVCQFEFRIVRL